VFGPESGLRKRRGEEDGTGATDTGRKIVFATPKTFSEKEKFSRSLLTATVNSKLPPERHGTKPVSEEAVKYFMKYTSKNPRFERRVFTGRAGEAVVKFTPDGEVVAGNLELEPGSDYQEPENPGLNFFWLQGSGGAKKEGSKISSFFKLHSTYCHFTLTNGILIPVGTAATKVRVDENLYRFIRRFGGEERGVKGIIGFLNLVPLKSDEGNVTIATRFFPR